MTDLHALSATRLCSGIRDREFSPREVLEDVLARIAAVNPRLNAVVALRADAARAEADAAGAILCRGDAPRGLLHGLPIALKESMNIEGMLTTQGSPLFATNRPAQDDTVVATLRANGAVVVGKTNLPELQHGMTSENTLYGLTRNAFDPEVSCQGSSGGSAVALSADMVPLCTGSDTGGSIRGPAATNGIWGLRPTPGLVGREDRSHAFNPTSVNGPMARTAQDLTLFLAAMVHENPYDPYHWGLDPQAILDETAPDLRNLRVAVSADLGCVDLDAPIEQSFHDKIDRIAPHLPGLRWATPDLGQIVRAFWLLRPLKFMAAMGEAYKADPHCMTEYKRTDFRRGFAASADQLVWAMAEQTRAFRAMTDFFRDFDVLITPGWATLPLTLAEIRRREAAMAAENARRAPFEYDFSRPEPSHSINPPITMTCHPVLTMPAGLGPTGHPFGFNLIGPQRSDAVLCALGRTLEPLFEADTALARPRPDLTRFHAEGHAHRV